MQDSAETRTDIPNDILAIIFRYLGPDAHAGFLASKSLHAMRIIEILRGNIGINTLKQFSLWSMSPTMAVRSVLQKHKHQIEAFLLSDRATPETHLLWIELLARDRGNNALFKEAFTLLGKATGYKRSGIHAHAPEKQEATVQSYFKTITTQEGARHTKIDRGLSSWLTFNHLSAPLRETIETNLPAIANEEAFPKFFRILAVLAKHHNCIIDINHVDIILKTYASKAPRDSSFDPVLRYLKALLEKKLLDDENITKLANAVQSMAMDNNTFTFINILIPHLPGNAHNTILVFVRKTVTTIFKENQVPNFAMAKTILKCLDRALHYHKMGPDTVCAIWDEAVAYSQMKEGITSDKHQFSLCLITCLTPFMLTAKLRIVDNLAIFQKAWQCSNLSDIALENFICFLDEQLKMPEQTFDREKLRSIIPTTERYSIEKPDNTHKLALKIYQRLLSELDEASLKDSIQLMCAMLENASYADTARTYLRALMQQQKLTDDTIKFLLERAEHHYQPSDCKPSSTQGEVSYFQTMNIMLPYLGNTSLRTLIDRVKASLWYCSDHPDLERMALKDATLNLFKTLIQNEKIHKPELEQLVLDAKAKYKNAGDTCRISDADLIIAILPTLQDQPMLFLELVDMLSQKVNDATNYVFFDLIFPMKELIHFVLKHAITGNLPVFVLPDKKQVIINYQITQFVVRAYQELYPRKAPVHNSESITHPVDRDNPPEVEAGAPSVVSPGY